MTTGASGPVLFARFAYPPNALGYCGPGDHVALIEQAGAGAAEAASVDRGLRALARGFDGAWPYLELIAGANHIDDPLDAMVVEAYWIGNDLLDTVDARWLAESLAQRFGHRAGAVWPRLVEPLPLGARPHHSFHVFGVYPWLGLIRSGVVDEPLRVLDRCRVRWGRVEHVGGDLAVVRSRPLVWDGRALRLGPPRLEEAVLGSGGRRLARPMRAGDWCAMHWDWVCDRLDPVQVRALRGWTVRQLAAVNASAHPAPAAVLA
jgi:hypothetical protein